MDTFYLDYKQGSYLPAGQSNNSMSGKILMTFLISEVTNPNSIKDYISLLEDPTFKAGTGNAATIQKDAVDVTLTLLPFEDMDPEPEFTTTIDNLIQIIKDWEYVHQHKFPQVLMTVEGDKVKFEPVH